MISQIVDLMTLPPLFLSVWLERTWLGLRFFRYREQNRKYTQTKACDKISHNYLQDDDLGELPRNPCLSSTPLKLKLNPIGQGHFVFLYLCLFVTLSFFHFVFFIMTWPRLTFPLSSKSNMCTNFTFSLLAYFLYFQYFQLICCIVWFIYFQPIFQPLFLIFNIFS